MTKENNIKIKSESKEMGCRTIDPTEGFEINKNTLTLFDFETYRSNTHNTSADVLVIENQGDTILIKVDSIDWNKNKHYPYTTQGCFLFQQTIEKYNKVHLSVDRVPCSKESIEEAIDFLTPAEVKKAKEAGKKIKRQGDFFFIEMKKKSNMDAINGTRHEMSGNKIKHPEHKILDLGKRHWKAIQRKTMNHIKAD